MTIDESNMKIRVPATSANLGPGFDSCGIALSVYLILEIVGPSDKWLIHHSIEGIPCDETNLIIQTALKVAPRLTPYELTMTTDIPPARGLGSSSSAIVAGIELANVLGNLSLSKEAKITIATEMEGHPDNVAPAICGDFVVASSQGIDQVDYVENPFPASSIVAYIPKTELLTSESRGALPQSLSYKEAVRASSISNVMVAAILKGDARKAGEMMEKDAWHEPYRAHLVPHLADIRTLGHQLGVYGSFLSGAGPTVLILTPKEVVTQLITGLEALPYDAEIRELTIDSEGSKVF